MKNVKILRYLLIIIIATVSVSCSDFFEVDNDTVLSGDDYMKENSELYSGFLGIMTKVQAIGDKSIYLTDTRAELIEPTENAPGELLDLYNYEDDLRGNSYADPAKYYDVIIACNDFLEKAKEFKDTHETSIDEEHYKGLISSTLRVKTWVYLTLAKIYGQAIWSDDPMHSLEDISKFEMKNFDEVLNSCESLLSNGFDGINGTYNMHWRDWLDPTQIDGETTSTYEFWDLMVPGYFVLQAEISLWKGDYQNTVNLLLSEMNKVFAQNRGKLTLTKYMRSGGYASQYGIWFNNASPTKEATESVIRYNYQYNQKNSLLKHFDANGDYLLRASLPGIKRFKDVTFNPPAKSTDQETTDTRFITFKELVKDEEYAVQKYRGMRKSSHSVAHDDVHVNIYHTADLYFMLVEALNNLGRYDETYVLMNKGFYAHYGAASVTWSGFTNDWGRNPDEGYRTYPDLGIRGVCGSGVGERDIWRDQPDNLETKKHNDLEILKEAMLEFPCEGKTYPIMLRIAKRWNDYSIISDLVCEKYTDVAKRSEIKNKIENGAYFVPWNLVDAHR